MKFHVGIDRVLIGEGFSTDAAGAALIFLVWAPDVAVMGSVGCEGFTAVLAFEGLLPRVLPDVCAEYAGGSKFLQRTESRRKSKLRQQDNLLSKGAHFTVTGPEVSKRCTWAFDGLVHSGSTAAALIWKDMTDSSFWLILSSTDYSAVALQWPRSPGGLAKNADDGMYPRGVYLVCLSLDPAPKQAAPLTEGSSWCWPVSSYESVPYWFLLLKFWYSCRFTCSRKKSQGLCALYPGFLSGKISQNCSMLSQSGYWCWCS